MLGGPLAMLAMLTMLVMLQAKDQRNRPRHLSRTVARSAGFAMKGSAIKTTRPSSLSVLLIVLASSVRDMSCA